MVSKLAFVRIHDAPEGETPDKLRRDEIFLVAVDAMILAEAEDSTAMLELWLENA